MTFNTFGKNMKRSLWHISHQIEKLKKSNVAFFLLLADSRDIDDPGPFQCRTHNVWTFRFFCRKNYLINWQKNMFWWVCQRWNFENWRCWNKLFQSLDKQIRDKSYVCQVSSEFIENVEYQQIVGGGDMFECFLYFVSLISGLSDWQHWQYWQYCTSQIVNVNSCPSN